MRHIFGRKSSLVLMALALAPCFALAKQIPPANRIPIEKAREAATAAYHGKIQGEELEFEGGQWIYSFDLKSKKDGRVHEVHIDAISGRLLDVHTETASDEKKELTEEAHENLND